MLGLKNTVLKEPATEEETSADSQKNDDPYAEIIQLFDDKIMRDAT